MLYPVYVWPGDGTHAYGAQVHDFPGCFSGADTVEELPAMVQEAVEAWCAGEDFVLPPATALKELLQSKDYQDGFWMLFDIDVARLDTKPVWLNISLPAGLVKQIDSYTEHHHITRSGFIAKAARKAMSPTSVDG